MPAAPASAMAPPQFHFRRACVCAGLLPRRPLHRGRIPERWVAGAGPQREYDEDEAVKAALERPPTMFWRIVAALFYMVPWVDSLSTGRQIYMRFRNFIFVYFAAGAWCGEGVGGAVGTGWGGATVLAQPTRPLSQHDLLLLPIHPSTHPHTPTHTSPAPGPVAKLYFSSQLAPLVIFFVMFLGVVKNKKLHHFVRFNAMQAVMLDIMVMLIHILRTYIPPQIVWSPLKEWWDMITWVCCFSSILYCVFWTLRCDGPARRWNGLGGLPLGWGRGCRAGEGLAKARSHTDRLCSRPILADLAPGGACTHSPARPHAHAHTCFQT